MIYECRLCPRACGAKRDDNSGSGFCRMGALPRVARIAPHMWEEPCISGVMGSGAIFFCGCTMACVYCQNYEISRGGGGVTLTPRQLADRYKSLEGSGVHNINLVSPSHFAEAIIESLDIYKPSVPVVYNCGGYESVETIERLNGYVDIFLPDFKYADNELAKRLSNAPAYRETALAAIERMFAQTGPARYDENGLMLSGVLVRHLILPNHTKNSIAVLKLISGHFQNKIPVSLMAQYFPPPCVSEYADINRKITRREYEKVLNVMIDLDLDGYTQSMKSASPDYVPDFSHRAADLCR